MTISVCSRNAYLAGGVNVAHIGGDTGCAAEIIEVELLDMGVELEEEGERLAV